MAKVLFVATYGDFLATFQLENIKLWKQLGCEVHCAANYEVERYNRFTGRLDEVGAVRHQLDFVRTPYSLKNFVVYKKLCKIIEDEQITVIDCHNPVPGILARFAALSHHIHKVVYTVHGFFFYKGAPRKNQMLYKPIEHFMARFTDALIVINKEDYEATKKMHIRGKSYYVHGVGVDLNELFGVEVNRREVREEFGIPDDAIVMISVGECIKRKNHEYAMRSFAKLDDPHSYYMIIGDGELLGYLKALSVELGIQDRVVFPGYRKDVSRIMKASDIYVFPSYQEGLSVALMEAMALGLPVIATAIRGNVDCIEDGKGGITVGIDEIPEMMDAMKKMLSDSDLRRQYGKYNQKKVKMFSQEVVLEENKKIFEHILENDAKKKGRSKRFAE